MNAHKKMIGEITETLRRHITLSDEKAKLFFKTGKGDYAEQDQFLGITVPHLRKIAKHLGDIHYDVLEYFIYSAFNEERFLALIILVNQYQKSNYSLKEQIYQFYLTHITQVNNWNLVDASAHWIIGAHLFDKNRDLLMNFAQSDHLWRKRIAIVSTWYFIRHHDLDWTFLIADQLLQDTHDLIHKAVGWMLREAGKRQEMALIQFLEKNAAIMPRTMLRYSIEKLDIDQKKHYLSQ